jgi:glycosyltransferase involved in cell wall biosynthesis
MCVDIIIPTYNAYDYLKLCLENIYKNTDLMYNRIILINDCSTDERIKPFIDEQANRKNVIVINNDIGNCKTSSQS